MRPRCLCCHPAGMRAAIMSARDAATNARACILACALACSLLCAFVAPATAFAGSAAETSATDSSAAETSAMTEEDLLAWFASASAQDSAHPATDDQDYDNRMLICTLILGMPVVIGTIVALVRCRTNPKPQFTDQYWREAPDPELQPAIVGRLLRKNKPSEADLTATILNLVHKGAICMDMSMRPDDHGDLVKDYRLTRSEAADAVTDPIENETMHLLFEVVAKGGDSLWTSDLAAYADEWPNRYLAALRSWQRTVTTEVNRSKLFDDPGLIIMAVSAFVTMPIMVLYLAYQGDVTDSFATSPASWAILALGALVFIAPELISRSSRRLTQRGSEIVARSEALKRWLQDFSCIDERSALDVKVWGELMVYASLLGVSDEALKEMHRGGYEQFDWVQMTVKEENYFYTWWYLRTSIRTNWQSLRSKKDTKRA